MSNRQVHSEMDSNPRSQVLPVRLLVFDHAPHQLDAMDAGEGMVQVGWAGVELSQSWGNSKLTVDVLVGPVATHHRRYGTEYNKTDA